MSTSKKAWSGWNSTPPNVTDPPRLLEDIISQEEAARLQALEEENYNKHSGNASKAEDVRETKIEGIRDDSLDPSRFECDETSNDLLLAQMLQLEFDKQADKRLQQVQDHYNKGERLQVSFEKYRSVHPSQQEELYHEDDYEVDETDVFDPVLDLDFGKKGYRGTGKNIVTKHNAELNSKHNAGRAVDNFPLSTDTGDTFKHGGVRIPNKVYNNLRVYTKKQNKRTARLHEKKDQSTATQAIDQKTRLELYKMLSVGLLEQVHGVISVGKESAVLHATGGEMETVKHGRVKLPDECALKVFKTTLAGFKNREKYVRGDYRLANEFSKQNPRKIMKMWAEKEMLNLKRMKKFGIPCPQVLKLRKHILIMQFIGRNQIPACKLKDAKLSAEDAMSVFHQIVQGVTNLYKSCSLVHADLSEYNLLWHEGLVYFIDVSQSVDLSHPLCHEFLIRDCRNICQFFEKLGLRYVISPYQLFNDITGMNLEEAGSEPEFLQQIQEYEKSRMAYATDNLRKEFAFDLMFEKTKNWSKSDKSELSNSTDEDSEDEDSEDEDEDEDSEDEDEEDEDDQEEDEDDQEEDEHDQEDADKYGELGKHVFLPTVKDKLSEKRLEPSETRAVEED